MVIIALAGMPFGTLVDKHHKRPIMIWTAFIAMALSILALIAYFVSIYGREFDWTSVPFWILAVLILVAAVSGAIRNLALSTLVTIMVKPDKRAKANGLVGTVQGIGFLVTSVFSGLAIGYLGMGWVLVISAALLVIAMIHILTVRIEEKRIEHDPELANKKVDIRGALDAVKKVPGLSGLIVFNIINNLIGGVYMALLDPYGLTLFSVQMWGIVAGIGSVGMIVGGGIVATRGLGKKPLRTLLYVNLLVAVVGAVMGIRESGLLLAVSMFTYMTLVPIIEAAEQTVLQRVVPLSHQGRVFGFSASIESLAAPVTSFMIAPIAQFAVIPYLNSAEGSARWEWLLGTGQARGIALIFLIAAILIFVIVMLAFRTRSYRQLSAEYAEGKQ